jgi:fructose-bisphosphate aldolase, class I
MEISSATEQKSLLATLAPGKRTRLLEVSQEEAVREVVSSAGRALVVLSGGSKIDDEQLLNQTRYIMEAGGSGVIYGRNVWQRPHNEALEIIDQIKEIMLSSVRRIP